MRPVAGILPWRHVLPPAEPVRLVDPAPPHHPEPRPDEPDAPVYYYVPLPAYQLTAAGLGRTEARLDPVVFGPPGVMQENPASFPGYHPDLGIEALARRVVGHLLDAGWRIPGSAEGEPGPDGTP